LDLLTFPGIAAIPGLVHGVTQRAGGVSVGPYASLNLGRSTGDEPAAVDENARRLRARLGGPRALRFPHQVHGARVETLEGPGETPWGPADAAVTAEPGLGVGVLGADCPVVLVVDPVRRALGVVHSGWRGTVAGVLPATIRRLGERYGSRPSDLRVGIGPGISAARFEVGPEVAHAVREGPPAWASALAAGRADRFHLDLGEVLWRQALACGVPPASIDRMAHCTYDDEERCFSHRRDGPRTGRHALVAVWTE
jgi:YfiH family protein